MSPFIDRAIGKAGLGRVLDARAAGDFERAEVLLVGADLLLVGAIADAVRAASIGAHVRIHPTAEPSVTWIHREGSELDLLRAVAIARITRPDGAAIGVDWGEIGLELAQVALGFGASDLTGPVMRKSGALIAADALKKVKGQGLVASAALKRREIAALVANAGRVGDFTDERGPAPREVAANA
jgi:hypothetical protein